MNKDGNTVPHRKDRIKIIIQNTNSILEFVYRMIVRRIKMRSVNMIPSDFILILLDR